MSGFSILGLWMSTHFPAGWMTLQASANIAYPIDVVIMFALGLENNFYATTFIWKPMLRHLYRKSLLYCLEFKVGLWRELQIDNIGDLCMKGVFKLFEWIQEKYRLNWVISLHISRYETMRATIKTLKRKKMGRKSQIMLWKIQVASYQQHHVYFRHVLPCLHMSIPWSTAWKWKYTSTKALVLWEKMTPFPFQ